MMERCVLLPARSVVKPLKPMRSTARNATSGSPVFRERCRFGQLASSHLGRPERALPFPRPINNARLARTP